MKSKSKKFPLRLIVLFEIGAGKNDSQKAGQALQKLGITEFDIFDASAFEDLETLL